jgi:hypothetical protein
MRGIITKVQVLAHPVLIVESFGLKVLVRALFADARETFLEIVTRCAEEDEHQGMDELDLVRTVGRFVEFERRVGELYRRLAGQFTDDREVAELFATLASHEEGHALVLSRVRCEIRRGHLWKASRALHLADVAAFDAGLAAVEEEVRRGVFLPRALALVDLLESSELNVVFDTLSGSVDMRSRTRFERFFVSSRRHLAYCGERIAALRARERIAGAAASAEVAAP